MIPNRYSHQRKIRRIEQRFFIQRMQKKRAFRKMKVVVEEFNKKQIVFEGLYANKIQKKNDRRDKLYKKIYNRFLKQDLPLPITIMRWIYDQ